MFCTAIVKVNALLAGNWPPLTGKVIFEAGIDDEGMIWPIWTPLSVQKTHNTMGKRTHGNTIAASPDLLLTIRQCLAITKIDAATPVSLRAGEEKGKRTSCSSM